jgi:hypothetical protein
MLTMEAEYYTPKEEDLFLGYEAQVYESFPQYNERNTVTHYESSWRYTVLDSGYKLNYWRNQLKDEHLRTPRLTPEQIEAEGWVKKEETWGTGYVKNGYREDLKRGVRYTVRMWRDKIAIHAYMPSTEDLWSLSGKWTVLDACVCPSINEFRKLIKLLNIEATKTAKASE